MELLFYRCLGALVPALHFKTENHFVLIIVCFHVTIFYRRCLRRTSGNVLKSEWFQKVMKIICMHWKLIMVYVYISWYVNCLVHDATGLVRRSCWPVSCSKKYIWCTVHTKKTWFNSAWMFFGILLERTANPCPPTWRGDPLFGWFSGVVFGWGRDSTEHHCLYGAGAVGLHPGVKMVLPWWFYYDFMAHTRLILCVQVVGSYSLVVCHVILKVYLRHTWWCTRTE